MPSSPNLVQEKAPRAVRARDPRRDPDRSAGPPDVKSTAKTVGLGLLFYAGAELVGVFLRHNDVGASAVQAALAEWGAGRVGVAWSDPLAKVPSWSAVLRRVATGLGLGLGVGAIVLAVVFLSHHATRAATAPVPATLAIGLLVAALHAVRDELFLRGLVLRTLSGWGSRANAALVCGVASAAARLGAPSPTPVEVAIAGVTGVCFAALWQRDRGAWMAVAAHTAWVFATQPVLHGGLLDIRFEQTSWGGGDVGIDASAAALCALVPVALAAVAWAARRSQVENL